MTTITANRPSLVVPSSTPATGAPSTNTPAPLRPADTFGGPLVKGVAGFNARLSVSVPAVRFVASADLQRFDANVSLPLGPLNLGGATVTKVSLPEPWRRDGTLSGEVPFSVSGGTLSVSIPEATPSTELWGKKTSPAFGLTLSDGRSLLVEVTPVAVEIDETANHKEGLETSISTFTQLADFHRELIKQYRAFAADPSRATSINPREPQVKKELARAIELQQSAQAQVDAVRPRARANFEAVPELHPAIAMTLLNRLGRADEARRLETANNTAAGLRTEVTQLAQSLEASGDFLSRTELAELKGALEQKQGAAATATAQAADQVRQVLASLPQDEVLALADDLRPTQEGFRSALGALAVADSTVSFWNKAVEGAHAEALRDVTNGLPRLEKMLAEDEAKLAALRTQLSSLGTVIRSTPVR